MNHSFPVDFFALGVIAYEFMTGKVNIILCRDLTLELIASKLDKKYLLSRYNSMKYLLMAGQGKA
jgi:hypothetical protein